MTRFSDLMHVIGATPITLLDKLRVGISVVDSHSGEIVFANEEFARIVGRSRDQLMDGHVSFVTLTHPDDRERNGHLQQQLLTGKIGSYKLEKRYLRANGSIVWAKVTVDILHKSDKASWTLGLVEDINARRILEHQLDAARNVAAVATWNWSVKEDVSTISASHNSLYGLPKSAPPPTLQIVADRVHPDDRAEFLAAINRGINEREGFTHEYRIIFDTGEIRWLRLTATCMYDAAGDVSNLIGATVDVTDLKVREFPSIVSQPIRNVLRHIEDNWDKPISLSELGRIYGVSPRTIQKYFASNGTTPNRFFKSIRLRKARRLLQSGDASTTVTSVALCCGFSNMGHFAKDYRAEFGEPPSDTIRLSRK